MKKTPGDIIISFYRWVPKIMIMMYNSCWDMMHDWWTDRQTNGRMAWKKWHIEMGALSKNVQMVQHRHFKFFCFHHKHGWHADLQKFHEMDSYSGLVFSWLHFCGNLRIFIFPPVNWLKKSDYSKLKWLENYDSHSPITKKWKHHPFTELL